MDAFRLLELPACQMASSGTDPAMDFGPEGRLGRFCAWFSALAPEDFRAFRTPRDFLWCDDAGGGFCWWWALQEGEDAGDFAVVPFKGGLYVAYTYRDMDGEGDAAAMKGALAWMAERGMEQDDSPGRFLMGHIITTERAHALLGYHQMETLVPVRAATK